MKFFILSCLLIPIMAVVCSGQETEVLKTFRHATSGIYSFHPGSLLTPQSGPELTPDHRLSIDQAYMKNGNLEIIYRIDDLRARSDVGLIRRLNARYRNQLTELHVRIIPYVKTATGVVIRRSNPINDVVDFKATPLQETTGKLTWFNFQNTYRRSDQDLDIILEAQVVGPSSLSNQAKPEFSMHFDKQPLHYMIGITGAIIAGIGIGEAWSANNSYKQYKLKLFEDHPDAASTLIRANNQQSRADIFRIYGFSTFTASLTLFAIKYLKYKAQLKDYNYYRKDGTLSVEPYLDNDSSGSSMGVKLKFQF